jgi:hypothetical protein
MLRRMAGFGSNLVMLEIAPLRQIGLEERPKEANVRIGKINDDKTQLGFNESTLRRTSAIC